MNTKDVLVIGAGVIGTTTAYELAVRGFRVRVLDASVGPAMETSFANAGELSYGYSGPWSVPGIVWEVPGMLMNKHSPLRIRPDFSTVENLRFQLNWLRWMGLNSKQEHFDRNKKRIVDLSSYSKECRLRFPVPDEVFDRRAKGTLQLFRTKAKFDSTTAADIPVLSAEGVDFTLVDRDGCVEQEPGLARIVKSIAGGIVFRADETGDCHRFTQALALLAEQRGVDFIWKARVQSLLADKNGMRGVMTNKGFFAAPTVVVATGPWTRKLLLPLGLKVPVYPVRGYSLTAPVWNEADAPVSTVLDQDSKVAITRFASRVRVGGTAEVGGFNKPEDINRRTMLLETVSSIFPGAVDVSPGSFVQHWAGYRPMTPDGTPIIGRTDCAGLYLNTGHGTLGWTQAFASAAFLSDLMTGCPTVLNPRDYELGRYGRRVRTDHFLPTPAHTG